MFCLFLFFAGVGLFCGGFENLAYFLVSSRLALCTYPASEVCCPVPFGSLMDGASRQRAEYAKKMVGILNRVHKGGEKGEIQRVQEVEEG